jgi:6-phosphogluconolactonase
LAADFTGENTTAHIEVHPSGKFLYASNRGHDSIAVFAIDQSTGMITAKGQTKTGGKTPRNFTQDPSGKFLLAANQNSNDIFVFSIDQETGALTPTGARIEVPAPVCLVFAMP